MDSLNKYIKLNLFNGDAIELNATSYDIDYKELTNQLNKIRTIDNKQRCLTTSLNLYELTKGICKSPLNIYLC